MLHANRPKRVKKARKAQVQPDEQADQDDYASEQPATGTSADGNSAEDAAALPDIICNQEEFDELVNDWMYDLELEDLASGKQRDMQQDGIIVKAPLASIFGTTLEILSDSNVETY